MHKSVVGVVSVALVAGVAATVVITRQHEPAAEASTAPCAFGRSLRVTAAPEIAPVLTAVFQQTTAVGSCPMPTVLSGDPATTADLVKRSKTAAPDVWVPDSSTWLTGLKVAGRGSAVTGTSVGSSPIVAAVSASAAVRSPAGEASGWGSLLPGSGAVSGPVRWDVPAPATSFVGTATVVGLRDSLTGRSSAGSDLATLARSARLDAAVDPQSRLDSVAAGVAVPATEQQVYAYNRTAAKAPVAAVYPAGAAASSADYPFAVLTTDPAGQALAAALLADLRSPSGQALVTAAGFRDTSGKAGTVLDGQSDVDGALAVPAAPPAAAATKAALSALRSLTEGSRVLTVIDVSGSMATPVPGASGASRLDLALRATVTGLASYPDSTRAGIWTFSTNLTRSTDYQQLVPIVPLGQGADGSSGRAKLGQALASIAVKPQGGTGLYDTVLAAVRDVQKGWDGGFANSVILVTDGVNDDDSGGIDLPTLLATLKSEQVPGKPVHVFPIAYGSEADAAALQQVVQVTGGTVYLARDPRDIGKVIQDAIGRRAS